MKSKKSSSFITSVFRFGLLLTLLIGIFGFQSGPDSAQAQGLPLYTPDPSPPTETVKLIFIHHSTGQNWLTDNYGGLGIALSENNYFVSDTNYGWGPNSIGDRTDIPNWTEWFASANTPTYMAALFTEYEKHSPYTRTLSDPGGENQIVMFKSCFPNSALAGSPTDLPSSSGWLTVGHAKWVYNQILTYFGEHPEKLFVVITAPPLTDGTYATNARAFNQWLMYDWLDENNYAQTNVAVFDFYNVLTGPNNHHRFINNAEEHVFSLGTNTLYYPSAGGDNHPNTIGSRKATDEFIELLNIFYHRWDPSSPVCHNLTLNSNPASSGTISTDPAPNCGGAYFDEGTPVNLTPNANFGYTFTNWSGDASGSDNPTSITMDGDHTVIANFSQIPAQPSEDVHLNNNRPTFDWLDHPGALGYQIQVSKNAAFTQLVINSSTRGPTTSSYTPISDLPANLNLFWRYRAKISVLESTAWSPIYTFQTANPPSAPMLLLPANIALVTSSSPLFDWKDSTVPAGTTFDHYQIQVATNNTFTSLIHENNVITSQDNTASLSAGTSYYWRVRAVNTANDHSAWSAVRSLRVIFKTPNLILPTNGSTVGTLKPAFTWESIVGASNYTIQISKASNFFPLTVNATVMTPTYSPLLSLQTGTVYYWRVRVNGLYGPSNWSNTFSFTTP